MEDLYEILGVPRNASQSEIKKAYRELVKQYHPDTHPGDKANEEKFKKINAAYTVLNDPEKRARYDQFGTIWATCSEIFSLRLSEEASEGSEAHHAGIPTLPSEDGT